jgi:hypothetical protein
MHTVAELLSFSRAAERVGMSHDEITDLVSFLAENPMAGDEVPGTGGCRKLRLAGRGKGKSGGYRTITFYSGESIPVYLITVFSKGVRVNLSKKERNQLGKITKLIVEEHQERVKNLRGAGSVRSPGA